MWSYCLKTKWGCSMMYTFLVRCVRGQTIACPAIEGWYTVIVFWCVKRRRDTTRDGIRFEIEERTGSYCRGMLRNEHKKHTSVWLCQLLQCPFYDVVSFPSILMTLDDSTRMAVCMHACIRGASFRSIDWLPRWRKIVLNECEYRDDECACMSLRIRRVEIEEEK